MKNKILLLCIIPLILSGCEANSRNSSDYQPKQYGVAISGSEREKIYADFLENFYELTSAERTVETIASTILTSGTQKTVEKYSIYENNLHIETKTTGHIINSDIEYDVAPEEKTDDIWFYSVGTMKRYIQYTIDDSDELKNVSVYKSESDPIKTNLLSKLFAYTQNNYLMFEVDDGYEMVYSNHQRTVGYAELGGQTRENISETKTQQIVHFDFFFKFKWSNYVSTIIKSIDPVTKEWYDQPKEVSRETIRIEGAYGEMEPRNESELEDDLQGTTVVWGIEPFIKTAQYSTSIADNNFTIDSGVGETSYMNNNLSSITNDFKIALDNRTSATKKRNALFGKVSAGVFLFDGKTNKAISFTNITFNYSYSSYYYNIISATTTLGSPYYYFTTSSIYYATFTFEYAGGVLSASVVFNNY